MTTTSSSLPDLHLVVGYDGSSPANRALDAALALRQGRRGHITVAYVAHVPSEAMFSANAVAAIDESLKEIEQDLGAAVTERLRNEEDWGFEGRVGIISDELLAVAKEVRESSPNGTVAIVVGTSSHAMHHLLGSVAVSLARRSSVPVVMVP